MQKYQTQTKLLSLIKYYPDLFFNHRTIRGISNLEKFTKLSSFDKNRKILNIEFVFITPNYGIYSIVVFTNCYYLKV